MAGILCGRSPDSPREVLVLSPSANGESALIAVAIDDITFVLPSFASPSEAQRCLTLPPGHPVIHSLLQKLRHLEIQVEEHTRRLVNRGAKDLFRRIEQTPSKKAVITTTGCLNRLREPRAHAEAHLAIHRILIDDPLHFIADPISMRMTGKFQLRTTKELQSFERLRGWVREQSPELKSFADKAARARLFGSKNPPTLKLTLTFGQDLGPRLRRLATPEALTWSDTDHEIILFLRRSLLNERALQIHPYMSIAPSIIKAVDETTLALGETLPYAGLDVGRLRIRSFLAEIGVVAPWEDWVVQDETAFLGWGSTSKQLRRDSSASPAANESTSSSDVDSLSAAVDHSSSPSPFAPPRGETKPNYYSEDALESVRHDFNQLPVYTIDDAGALELDDGISIDSAPPSASGSPTWWVHIHVADPTAVLGPSHPLSHAARIRDHTEYFPEMTWSMLPDWFVEEQKMSLGSLEGKEQRTLSISMRVDETGEVLESDVRVGIVRNVKRLTYSAVNEVLGASARPPAVLLTHPRLPPDFDRSLFSVSPSQQRFTEDAQLPNDSTAINDLTTLRRLATAMLRRRADSNALYWTFPSASVAVAPRLKPNFSLRARPGFYRDLPLVSLTLPTPSRGSSISPAQLLVSEMMVAANRAAARFSVERGLPAPFRTQAAPIVSSSVLQEVLAARDPATGEADGEDILRLGVDFLPGSTSAEPGAHWPMGINDEFGYLKVTSPLRRYSDLFTHWQLKSALLPSATAPHFTRSAVLQHIAGFDLAHKARGRLSKHAEHYWALYVLKNKLDALNADSIPSAEVDPVAALLLRDQPLSGLALRDPSFSGIEGIWVQPVLVKELGLRATLHSEKSVEAPGKGDTVSVKVQDILLGPRSRMIVKRHW